MPPFLGQAHFHLVMQTEAVPAIERLAANDIIRDQSLRRFERDDPPPYVSSTESSEFDDDFPIPQSDGRLPDELTAVMDSPLTDHEISSLANTMRLETDPAESYRREVKYQEARKATTELVSLSVTSSDAAGRDSASGILHSAFLWEQDDTNNSGPGKSEALNAPYKGELLVQRALRLRQNLRRGESSPIIPRSHLRQDATASEAESFIISRPWFIHSLEVVEENLRFWRLDPKYIHAFEHAAGKQVNEWWKTRGDWREKFDMRDGRTLVSSWKWGHESPSPEPEDLTPIDNMKDSLLDSSDMEFTPSEIDALEAIPPLGHVFPKIPATPISLGLPSPLFNPFESKEIVPEDHQDEPQEAEEQILEPQLNASGAPPHKTQGQSQRQPQDKERDIAQGQDKDQPVTPRRSSRIAGTKRSAESLPSQSAPNKKHKGTAMPRVTALETQPAMREIQRRMNRRSVLADPGPPPLRRSARIAGTTRPATRETQHRALALTVSTSLAPGEGTKTRSKRGRGRPRKENRPSIAMVEKANGFLGMLIEMDVATKVDVSGKNQRSGAQQMRGTIKYMAIAVI
ncbi:hypothetical protein MMC13_000709 [Lambiella insularis]|nr:hypothetical protein [Lambiella insularis]